jgi:hypothetical protein
VTPTNRVILEAVLSEVWKPAGALVYANGRAVLDATAVESGPGATAIESARARVAASAPMGVRLARFVEQLRRSLEEPDADYSDVGKVADGAWLTEQQWQELTSLAAETLATAEGSR